MSNYFVYTSREAFDAAAVSGQEWGVNAFGSIQEAINAADGVNPVTINVGAGTYNENFTLKSNITLLGAQAGNNANGRTGDESVINGKISTGAPLVYTNITIDGFTVTAPDATGNSGVIYFQGGDATSSNLVVKNNIVNAVSGIASGVVFNISVTTSYDNCEVSGNVFNGLGSSSTGIRFGCTSSNSVISGNTVTAGAGYGIMVINGSDATISNNTVSGATREALKISNIGGTYTVTGNTLVKIASTDDANPERSALRIYLTGSK